MNWTALNWKELQILVEAIGPQLQDLFVEKVIVPERPRFPMGYIKGEWVLRLSGKRRTYPHEFSFLFSVRPRHPYIGLGEGKGPKAAVSGTRSAFDLVLSKYLEGLRLQQVQAIPKERVCVLWFLGAPRLGLVISLIPAVPEAILVRDAGLAQGWEILARSRANGGESTPSFYLPPDGAKAPENPKVRTELVSDPKRWLSDLEKALGLEAYQLRIATAQRALRDLMKQADQRIHQSQVALEQGRAEPDWQHYGDLFKASLHVLPPVNEKGERLLVDFQASYDSGAEQKVSVPCDPKLNPQQQLEKFYHAARRKVRRIEEAEHRVTRFGEKSKELRELLAESEEKLGELDWKFLGELEIVAQTEPSAGAGPAKKEARTGWLGRAFRSKDGLSIFVGRSKDENLELTFKVARGNDLWMHVRGRPGAHVVIPLQPGKSAPLETLLDAAALTVYYSGGEKWGKTEVDYTFKKHVKRIKDSTEASYTHNKTLIMQPDPGRLKRLIDIEERGKQSGSLK